MEMKSFWRQRASSPWSFYCPLCAAPRRLSSRPKPEPRHLLQILLTAAFFTLVGWRWFEWKGIVIFLPLWVIFEVIYRSRVRAKLPCPHCGFDPYLYLVDVQKARREIESYWRKKFEEKGIPYPERQHSERHPSRNHALTGARPES